MRMHIPTAVTAKPKVAVNKGDSSQVTDKLIIPDDDTAVGVKVMILVRFPVAFVVKVSVNPMLVKDVPTGSLDENSTLVSLKTPLRFVLHLKATPVLVHVQIL